jgi:hypothetical protein
MGAGGRGRGRGGGWAGSSVFSTGLSAAVVAFRRPEGQNVKFPLGEGKRT